MECLICRSNFYLKDDHNLLTIFCKVFNFNILLSLLEEHFNTELKLCSKCCGVISTLEANLVAVKNLQLKIRQEIEEIKSKLFDANTTSLNEINILPTSIAIKTRLSLCQQLKNQANSGSIILENFFTTIPEVPLDFDPQIDVKVKPEVNQFLTQEIQDPFEKDQFGQFPNVQFPSTREEFLMNEFPIQLNEVCNSPQLIPFDDEDWAEQFSQSDSGTDFNSDHENETEITKKRIQKRSRRLATKPNLDLNKLKEEATKRIIKINLTRVDQPKISVQKSSIITIKESPCLFPGCRFVAGNEKFLEIHMKSHSGPSEEKKKEKFIKCEICGRNFANKKNLTHHERSHLTTPKYNCGECGKPCYYKQQLKRHEELCLARKAKRDAFKPYCEVCNRTYDDDPKFMKLKRHKKICKPNGPKIQQRTRRKTKDGKTTNLEIVDETFKIEFTELKQSIAFNMPIPINESETKEVIGINQIHDKNLQVTQEVNIKNSAANLQSDDETPDEDFDCESDNWTQKKKSKSSDVNKRTKSSDSTLTLKKQLKSKNSESSSDFRRNKNKSSRRKMMDCPYENCNYKSYLKPRFEAHLKNHEGIKRPWICETCGQAFRQRYQLIAHEEIHIPGKTFLCVHCGKSCINEQQLKRHEALCLIRQQKATAIDGKCPICERQFPPEGDKWARYKRHVKICERNYERRVSQGGICHICNNPFPNLARHMIHHESGHVCLKCGTKFENAKDLHKHKKEKHSAAHAPDREKCEQCDKYFSNKNLLKIHTESVHDKILNHFCPVCNKGYYALSGMRIHMAVHDESLKVVCQFPGCGRKFNRPSLLNTHFRSHTQHRPFICRFCPKSFRCGTNLHVHESTHSKETPFMCEKCGKGFKDACFLRLHMKWHEGAYKEAKIRNRKLKLAKLKEIREANEENVQID